MKNKILLILLALILQFYADYSFLFQTIHETWVAGGSNDYVYLAAYTLMSLGLFQLGTTATALRSKS